MLLTAGCGLATFVGAGAGVEAPGPGAAQSPCRGPGRGHSNLRWQLAVGSGRGAEPVLFWSRRTEAELAGDMWDSGATQWQLT